MWTTFKMSIFFCTVQYTTVVKMDGYLPYDKYHLVLLVDFIECFLNSVYVMRHNVELYIIKIHIIKWHGQHGYHSISRYLQAFQAIPTVCYHFHGYEGILRKYKDNINRIIFSDPPVLPHLVRVLCTLP